MNAATDRTRSWLWLIRLLGIIVPRTVRADWRQEWEAELLNREWLLEQWDQLNSRGKLDLILRSVGAFWDALWMQSHRWEEAIVQDLRFGLRMFAKQPGLTIIGMLTIALGIGANTAIFSVVNMVLLSPLPYPNSDRLVAIWSSPSGARNRWTSAYPDYLDWKANTATFERIAVYGNDRSTLRAIDEPVQLVGAIASAELFPIIGVEPEIGRFFTAEEDRINAVPVAMISHECWQRYFDSRPDIVGSSVSLGGRSVTIVGVMPAGFKFPVNRAQVDYYLPVSVAASDKIGHRSDMFLQCVALLRPDANLERAQTDIAQAASQLATAYPDTNQSRTAWLTPLREDLVGDTRPALLILFGSVGLVLLIACANVANLLLTKTMARRRETAIRIALGASPWRIVRQLVVESAILASTGGLFGFVIGQWAYRTIMKIAPAKILRLGAPVIDLRVMLFALTLVVVVVVLAGVLPALQASRVSIASLLASGDRVLSDGGSVNRARSVLVVAQIAVSVAIWISAGLLIRSFVAVQKKDPGFEARGVLTAPVTPDKLKSLEKHNQYYQRILERLSAAAGIEAAAAIAPLPFSGSESDTNFSISGRPPVPIGQEPLADYRVASTDYFEVMKIPVLRGRAFLVSDGARSQPVVLINDSFARRFFGDDDPLDHCLIIGADPRDNPNPPLRRIVGIVGDVSHVSLEAAPVPEFYIPIMQDKWPTMNFVVRETPGRHSEAVISMREAMRSVESGEYVPQPRMLTELLAQSLRQREFTTALLGTFAWIALLLATIGVFGVMSHKVQLRTREFAIRLALGAGRSDVLKAVLKQGMTLAAIGVALGLTLARISSGVIAGLTYEISETDVATFIVVALLLLLVALFACLLPAWRATRVDPMIALREEC